MEVADAIIITNQGRVEQIGTPDEICLHPQTEFVADFIDAARYEALAAARSSEEWLSEHGSRKDDRREDADIPACL